MDARLGIVAGHELLGELGRGGMGVVYRARHLATGAERALKILSPPFGPDDVERFRREAEALARVNGSGVVAIHETGIERGRPYIVMPLLRGGTLRERMRTKGRLPWREAVALVHELAMALERCHRSGVVHRDLKPSNVLFDEEGRPWLTDLGCARDLTAGSLTETGALVGTPVYMAPEQFDGTKATALSDIYALGLILHELVSGEAPFKANTLIESVRKKIHDAPPPLLPLGAPQELDQVLARALAREPGARFESADALASALANLDGAKGAAKPVAGSRRALAVALAVLLFGTLGVALAVAKRDSAPPSAPPPPDAPRAPRAPAPPPPSPPPAPPERKLDAFGQAIVLLKSARSLEGATVLDDAAAHATTEGRLLLARAARARIEREREAAMPTDEPALLLARLANAERAEEVRRPCEGGDPPSAFHDLLEVVALRALQEDRYADGLRTAAMRCVRAWPAESATILAGAIGRWPGAPPSADTVLESVDQAIALVGSTASAESLSGLVFHRARLRSDVWCASRPRLDADSLHALADLDAYLARRPSYDADWAEPWSRERRARILAELGRFEEALADWKTAAPLRTATQRENDRFRNFERLHARLRFELGDDARALEILEREVLPGLAREEHRKHVRTAIERLRGGPVRESERRAFGPRITTW